MAELKTIVGIKKTTSKKTGKNYFEYYMTEGYSDYEKENAVCTGVKVVSESCGIDFGVNIGDQVKCYFEKAFGDQLTLTEMIVKVPAGKKQ